MHRQIAVARVEPRGLAELSHGLQAEKCVALHSPAALAAQHAREHVGDGVNVGRDVESPPQKIVAGVDDKGDFFCRHDLAKAIDELCAPCSAAEDTDHAALRARPSSAVQL